MRNEYLKLGAISALLACVLLAPAIFGKGKDTKQLKADEICVDYTCHKGNVNVSLAYTETEGMLLYINRDGKTITVPVVKEERYKGRLIVVFAYQKGFMSIGSGDKTAFINLDGSYITLNVSKQNFI